MFVGALSHFATVPDKKQDIMTTKETFQFIEPLG